MPCPGKLPRLHRMTEPLFQPVLPIDALPENSSTAVTLSGMSIALCHSQGEIFAIENRCSHADEPLACGRMRLGWIACPAHGARFDLAPGEALGPPANAPIRTFAVRVSDGMIEVEV